jgi:hypothetical protein
MAKDIELTVTVRDLQTVDAKANDGGTGQGSVRHDALRAATIQVIESWLRRSSAVSRAELEVLGEHLFETLFEGEVRTMLTDRLAKATIESPLRLQLVFKEPAEKLARYSWEYLYLREGSGKSFFLSTFTKLVLSRFMPTTAPRPPLIGDEHSLRILMAVAEPPEDSRLGPVAAQPVVEAVEGVAKQLREGFRPSEKSPLLICDTSVEVLRQASADELMQRIDAFRPHVVHLIGHGRFDRATGEGAVALLKSGVPDVDWVSDKQMKDRFINLDRQPQLVFLHMCQGGEVDFEKNFAGVAPQLITAGVQAVVAMQHPISNAAAIRFAQEFYKRIGGGEPVDHAVQFGRSAVATCDRSLVSEHAFGTPVLYMQASDGIIVPPLPQPPGADGEVAGGLAGGPGAVPQSAVPSRGAATASGATAVPAAADALATGRQLAMAPSVRPATHHGVAQLAGRASEPASAALQGMRKAGRQAAALDGRLDGRLAARIDGIARTGSPQAARDELQSLIAESDDDLQLVWSAMIGALRDADGAPPADRGGS